MRTAKGGELFRNHPICFDRSPCATDCEEK